MSSREVLGCVAVVVSAFHTAAETLEAIKERKEKKKRKKEKEIEELVEIKLLHKSLIDVRRPQAKPQWQTYAYSWLWVGCDTMSNLQRGPTPTLRSDV